MSRRDLSPQLRSVRRLYWPFLLPALALFAVVFLVPIALTVLYSFGDVDSDGIPRFTGLGHYRELIDNPLFWSSLEHTFEYALESTVVLFVPAILLSWALSIVRRGRRFYRVMLFAPVMVSTLVAALVWSFIFNPISGPINEGLHDAGLHSLALPWLGDSRTAMSAVVIAAVWQSLGLWIVLISAGLEKIEPDLLEAARIDGAGRIAEFRLIALPLLWPVLRALILLWFVQAVQVFAFVFIMTGGTSTSRTSVVSTYIFDAAFNGQDYGGAAAMATVTCLAVAAIGIALAKVLRVAKTDG